MGRKEKGSFKDNAGLELFKEIRNKKSDVPFVILTTSNNVRKYASEAKSLGVTSITSSPTELFAVLQREISII
jgi:DNA-binding NarL/FixJ family response regulator